MRLKRWATLLLFAACITPLGAQGAPPLRGFSDIGFGYSKTDAGSANSFYHGGIDLFLTDNLSDKVNYLIELVFEVGDDNAAVVDIERILLQYYVSPWFRVGAGRFHTALGYWNDTCHHGACLQASIERPLMYRFEDDTGILPVHAVGLEFRGEGDMGPGKFGYVGNVGNGRGPKVDPPQVVNDADTSKAFNMLAYYRLPQMGNLRFGGTAYFDTLPGDDRDADGTPDVKGKETIFGGHVAWQPGDLEILAEVLNVGHKYDTGEATDGVLGLYGQIAYKISDFTPYFRYDQIKAKNDLDAYTEVVGTTSAISVGSRYDLTVNSALKLEYNRINRTKPVDNAENVVGANWCFSF